VQADLAPPLCTPEGLARLRKLTAAKARPWLVAACGPEIHAGFFQALAGRTPLPVVDSSGKLLGMLSRRGLLEYLLNEAGK
jgi:CBS domain-containing protein